MTYNTEDIFVLILCFMLLTMGTLSFCKYNTTCCINQPRTQVIPETPTGYIHPLQDVPALPVI